MSPLSRPTVAATVGIFAHNEQATVRQVVNGFLNQRVTQVEITEVVVICCGCTDSTVSIVKEIATADRRVRLILRPKREGKIAAIAAFVEAAESEVLVLCSGDVVPAYDLVELLVLPIAADLLCMMTGPRIVVAHEVERRLVDHLNHALWGLHHAVARQQPKLGELVAVRRELLTAGLPPDIHCDEALIESMVLEHGGRLKYVEEAVVSNFSPASVSDLYRQRRRIAAQHRALQRLRGYSPSTSEPRLVLNAALSVLSEARSRWPVFMCLAALEITARVHGRWDAVRGRTYRMWDVRRPPVRDDMPLDGHASRIGAESTHVSLKVKA